MRRFGALTAVDDVSFHIDPGENYRLLGSNGAGKTTIISMVVDLIAADEGSVHVVGEPVSPTRVAAERHLGLVPQQSRRGAGHLRAQVLVAGDPHERGLDAF